MALSLQRLRRSGTRSWLGLAVLLALCARSLVPGGAMATAVDGGMRIVLCGDVAATQASGASHDEGRAPQHDNASGATCLFALNAGGGPAPAVPAAVPEFSGLAASIPDAGLPGALHAAPPPRYSAPRGPPGND